MKLSSQKEENILERDKKILGGQLKVLRHCLNFLIKHCFILNQDGDYTVCCQNYSTFDQVCIA